MLPHWEIMYPTHFAHTNELLIKIQFISIMHQYPVTMLEKDKVIEPLKNFQCAPWEENYP